MFLQQLHFTSTTGLKPQHGASIIRVGALPVPCSRFDIFFSFFFLAIALSSLLSNTADMVKLPETTIQRIECNCYKKKYILSVQTYGVHINAVKRLPVKYPLYFL